MDNVTHTLVGALIGVRCSRGRERARAIVVASMISNNAPDADLLVCPFLSQPFGYLLHHRGHTHTILGAIIAGLAIWFLFSLWSRVIGRAFDSKTSQILAWIAVGGGLVHLGLDSFNTYGVHPFWPFENSWYYGDTLFILEPTLWITLSLALLVSISSVGWRLAALGPALGGIGLLLFSHHVPPRVLILLLVLLGGLLTLTFRLSRDAQFRIWVVTAGALIACFFESRALAVKMAQRRSVDSEQVVASFLSPSPANPFCWTLSRMVKSSSEVVYTREILQPFENVFPLDCAQYSLAQEDGTGSSVAELARIPFRTLETLSANCRWRAFLRFAREPAVIPCGDGGECSSDLRFSWRGARNFTSWPLEGECPAQLPGWIPPVPEFETGVGLWR